MNDRDQITELYKLMYKAMIDKDTATLNRIHAPEFVLIHMTGMRQSKQQYINAIANGNLNYFSAVHKQIDINIDGDRASLTGRSLVSAAVFGGGRHSWHLQLSFTLAKLDGSWFLTACKASTY